MCGRLLEDAQTDPYYQSWLGKIQAALQHCCGRALREELELETRLTSVLVQMAEKIRAAEKTRRKVGKNYFLPDLNCSKVLLMHLLTVFFFIFCIQNILKKEAAQIKDFFKDGISCCLPLDPAVRVQGLDVDVRPSAAVLVSKVSPKMWRIHSFDA